MRFCKRSIHLDLKEEKAKIFFNCEVEDATSFFDFGVEDKYVAKNEYPFLASDE